MSYRLGELSFANTVDGKPVDSFSNRELLGFLETLSQCEGHAEDSGFTMMFNCLLDELHIVREEILRRMSTPS